MSERKALSPEEAEHFVNRRLTLRHLRVLQALHDAGSLSEAAERLHVTQPAISKTLTEIEQGLGQTLFVRHGRGVRATHLGLRLVELAARMDAQLHRGAEDVAALVRGASGELLIGATNAALAQILPDAIARMKRDHPRVTLSVRSHALRNLFEELREGRLDLVIARVPPHEEPSDLHGHTLVSQREVLVMSTQHPLAKSPRVGWQTLSEQAWIWHLPGTRSRALQDRLWHSMGLALPQNVIETGDQMLTLSLLRRIPCVTVLPLHAARLAAQNGLAVILPLDANLGLADLTVWHLREPQSELTQQFIQHLHAAATEPD